MGWDGTGMNCYGMGWDRKICPWTSLANAFGMRKYFSEDYVIPSPKLNEDQKKDLRR